MKIVITSSHYRRPQYTAKSVAAIASQPEASSLHYIASIDRSDRQDEVIAAIEQYRSSFKEMTISIRDGNPSCNENIKQALNHALNLNPDFVIMVEDDVILGHDALAYFIKQASIHKDDQNIFTISAWRHPDGWLPSCGRDIHEDEHNTTGINNWFVPWGWGTWVDRLEEMLIKWTTGNDHSCDENHESWDRVLGLPNGTRGNRFEVQPMISRATNIGDIDGTHRGAVPLSYWIGGNIL